MSERIALGWKLDRGERDELLRRFPAVYENAVADHVTLRSGVAEEDPLPAPASARIVGRVDDGRGVEAMVAEIDGTTNRPDGGTYHITWSLADGRRARESNDAIAACGWTPLDEPVPVFVEPARW
jgi:hypothetical protein